MERVSGRTDDMLIIRGVNVFPSQIESVLLEIEGVAPHYQIEVDRQGALDEVTVHVEVTPSAFSDEARRVIEMRDRIQRRLATVLGISIRVRLAEPGHDRAQRREGEAGDRPPTALAAQQHYERCSGHDDHDGDYGRCDLG